jgi:DNA-binding NarL/FixJ family response regulator
MPHDGMHQRPRVLVVDDHGPMLEYAALTLEEEFTVVARLRDVESLMDEWVAAKPDVVVMDVALTGCSGFDAVARLRAAGCRAATVFLSVHEEPEFVEAAWEAGGLGYVAKRDVGCALVPAVRAALRGQRYVSAAIGSV